MSNHHRLSGGGAPVQPVRDTTSSPRGWSFWLWLGCLGAVTLVLRLPLLAGSFWLDEAAQALEVVRPWSQQLAIAADFQPPLFHLLLHVWQYGGHQEWWLRLVSVWSGILSTLVFAALAWRWLGRRASFMVGIWLATSSLMVFYSQELRPYMLAVAWASLALWAYWQLLWPPSQNTSQPRTAPRAALQLYILANLAGALTSYVYLFFMLAQAVSALWVSRRAFGQIVRALSVSGLFWLAWLPGLLEQLAASRALRLAVPGWEAVVSLSQLKAVPVTLAKFWLGIVPVDWSWHDAILVILTCTYVFYIGIKHWQSINESAKRGLLVSLSLGVVTILASWLFSFWTPVITPKRVLFLLPLMYLVSAQVSTRFTRGGWVVFLVILGLNVWGLGRYWTEPALQRENWRAAVAAIEARYRPDNTVVVFGFDAPFAPWAWYQRENLPTQSTGFAPLATLSDAFVALEPVSQYENVVLFDYLLDLSDPQHYLSQVLEAKGYTALEVLDYPQLGFIRLYYQQKLFAETIAL